jgi:hypothetical protein
MQQSKMKIIILALNCIYYELNIIRNLHKHNLTFLII